MTTEAEDDPVVPVRSCAPPSSDAPPPGAAPSARDASASDSFFFPADEPALPGERRMSLGDHLAELRSRVILCLAVFVILFLAGLLFYAALWDAVRLPLAWAAEGLGKRPEDLVKFQGLSPAAGFTMIADLDLAVTLLLILPLLIQQFWAFVSPGLTRRERGTVFWIFTAGTGLFLLGAVSAFRIALPIAMRFLIQFNASLPGFENNWTGDEYFSFVTMVGVGFGAGCETPLVMMALGKFGLITPAGVLHYWRHTILFIVVMAAILTPSPDPVSQVVFALPMILLFFIGYGLVRWVAPKDPDAA